MTRFRVQSLITNQEKSIRRLQNELGRTGTGGLYFGLTLAGK